MTLTTRLSLFFLTALALVLLGFSAALYCLAAKHLHRQLDERLDAALNVLTAAAEIDRDGVEWEPHARTLAMEAEGLPIHWTVQTLKGQRVDGSPEPVLESAGWRSYQRQISAPSSASPHEADSWRDHEGNTHYPSLVIVAALPEAQVQQTLRTLALTLAGLSLALWTVAALMGRWLCRRALTPLHRMAETARTITAADLDRRLPATQTGDELADLGQAFNELLARLQESFERQRRFTGDASHQLRTPLTVMLGQVEVALRRERSPEEYRRVLAVVHEQTAKLREIGEMLLFLALADAEAKRPQLEALDLAAWLAKHVQSWSAQERYPELHVDAAAGSSFRVLAQTPLLGQLVDNLLENACKYSAAGTPITLRLSNQGDQVLLAVQDEGCGIEAQELAHVFEPFFRSAQARRQGHSGVGLGLAVAWRIAEAMGGQLEVASTLGQGSCFTLRLPHAAEIA